MRTRDSRERSRRPNVATNGGSGRRDCRFTVRAHPRGVRIDGVPYRRPPPKGFLKANAHCCARHRLERVMRISAIRTCDIAWSA
jgi:hypothetical protein